MAFASLTTYSEGMPKKLDPKVAEAVMLQAKFQPQEPYKGANALWKVKCLLCGKIVKVRYGNIKYGFSGRKQCCSPVAVIDKEAALKQFEKCGFTVLELYTTSSKSMQVKCNKCKKVSKRSYQSLTRKGKKMRCVWCADLRKDSEEVVNFMLQYDLKPLEQYKGANEPWKCKCLRTGKTVSPSFSSIRRSKKHVCKFCGQNFVDPKEAIKFMISKGYKPQVPYTTGHANWESMHIPCGNIVSPQYAQIQQGFGGCRHCADWGFQYGKNSYLYLITNPSLNAHKVGIANVAKRTKGDRLRRMQNDGWVVFKVWHFDEGKRVLNIEKKIFKILRDDMQIPQYLSKGEMKHEGETETVDADSITLLQLEKIIKKVIKGLQE